MATRPRYHPITRKRIGFVPPGEEQAHAEKQQRAELNEINREIALLERQKMALEARDNLLTFTKFTMPDPEDPNDVNKTRYDATLFHTEIAKALEAVERGEIRQLIFCMPPRHGKSILHSEPVLTPTGWRQHGDLRVGDFVFGPDGQPTEVVALSADVGEVVPVTFSNGDVVRCHLNHEWTVFDRAAAKWRTLETRDIAKRVLRNGPDGKRGGRWTLQLPDTPAVQFAEAVLPLHPYVLGAWLGDGAASSTRIAHDARDQEVIAAIKACGHSISSVNVHQGTGVHYTSFGGRPGRGSVMHRALKSLGVLNDKHIPEIYLRSSVEQRLELLGGLIDTDGHVEARTGRVRFSTCSEKLRDGVFDLAAGLGFRPYVVEVAPTVSSSGIVGKKVTYQVGFQPTRPVPTRIPRKQIRKFAARRRVAIVSVGPVEKGGARSIQVARADGLYLVGKHLNVTHNTELATKRFAAWFMGRNPQQDLAVASYSDTMAEDMGADTRAIMSTPQFKQAFPAFRLRRGGTAKNNIQTDRGGRAVFVGRGGALTGRGANLLLIDDLYKDHEDARSQAIRDQAWNWFTKVAMTRRMGKKLVVITMTRWHSDDIIGRLTDPESPHYNAVEAKNWKIIRLPAIAEEDDTLNRKPGEVLWPERYDLEYMAQQQRIDPLGFAALFQQRPTVADGVLFRREHVRYYEPGDLPSDLRVYSASDHAVSTDQRRDATVLLTVGVDKQHNIYLLDCWWQRAPTDRVVEAMLEMARTRKPLIWWAEKGHISKSIGPFLRKRMQETETFFSLREVTPAGDKEQRAQSISARMALGYVWFPKNAFWTERAVNELLAFPNGNHDDFVDTFAYIGLGLQSQFAPKVAAQEKRGVPKYGTFAWVKWASKQQQAAEAAARRGGF